LGGEPGSAGLALLGRRQAEHVLALGGTTYQGQAGDGLEVGEVDRVRAGVVVDDGADSLRIAKGRVDRAGQIDEESLVRFDGRVAVDRHGDRFRSLTGSEGQRAAGG